MIATFNIKVSITPDSVSTSFGSEKIEDMDTALLTSVLKVLGDMNNKVKTQVAKFYNIQSEQQGSIPGTEGDAETAGDLPLKSAERQEEVN